MRALVLQLADSAFPTGGFAHSQGLEALRQLGHLRGEEALRLRLHELVWSTALGALPFVAHAHAGDAEGSDRACEAFLSNQVANRASRAQGAAFLLAAEAAFGATASPPWRHQAPAFGAVLRALEVSLDETRSVYLHAALRGALSAAVRLGVVGPLRAQALHAGLHPLCDEALRESADLRAGDAVAVAPLVEVCQSAQDRLYTRLFQS